MDKEYIREALEAIKANADKWTLHNYERNHKYGGFRRLNADCRDIITAASMALTELNSAAK
jgi:hypothetical protein